MLYQIMDGSVSLGGELILSHFDFEIKANEKIAVVGRNGAGKTTLLRLVAGALELDRDDKRQGAGIYQSRRITVGMLEQQSLTELDRTVEEELLAGCPAKDTFDRERFAYEREYDVLFTGFGFSKEDKKKSLKEFSGGEQTKIALIRLLLQKPDILLLDEPTNHLDVAATEWLESYLRDYEKAVVFVSHDRFFTDRVADIVYEVENRKLTRYYGNYTEYRKEKRKKLEAQRKAYERQQEEINRLNEVIERFKHKPTKAAFARAKKKQLERMERVKEPNMDEVRLFTGEISPMIPGSKWVLEAEHLSIGYAEQNAKTEQNGNAGQSANAESGKRKQLVELSLRIRRGQKIGLLGSNGVGKSTFLKTIVGLVEPLRGTYTLGNQITIGYFDQHSAQIHSEKSVLEHFSEQFPSLSEKEVRSILGAYLFRGKEASRRVCDLSGGEKARLVLAELLQSRPNFLILDEPTNHMDVQAKEVLESAFQAYTGTLLFVSHDRYFIRQVAESVLIFEGQSAFYYPFGYEHYLERSRKIQEGESIAAQVSAEDQALIESLRAVPRAERHRLREIPTEEAYLDWKLRLVMERLEPAAEQYEDLEEECCKAWQQYIESEAYWSQEKSVSEEETASQGETAESASEYYRLLLEKKEQAWQLYHACCMEWLEIWIEEGADEKNLIR